MDNAQIRRHLHDLANSVNAAKINAFLLRRLGGDKVDAATMDRLDAALLDAERLLAQFQQRIHDEGPAD